MTKNKKEVVVTSLEAATPDGQWIEVETLLVGNLTITAKRGDAYHVEVGKRAPKALDVATIAGYYDEATGGAVVQSSNGCDYLFPRGQRPVLRFKVGERDDYGLVAPPGR